MSSHMVVDPTTSVKSRSRVSRDPGILDSAIVLGFCALLIFAVLAFGAVDEWSTFTLEAGAALLFLLWAAKQLLSQQVKLSNNPLYLPAVLFGGLILAQILLHRSAYGYVTKYEALQYVSYGSMLFIAAECLTAESLRKLFAEIISIFGFLYASSHGAGADSEWKDFLGLHLPLPQRYRLRKLRQPQSFCRSDGDADADSLCR